MSSWINCSFKHFSKRYYYIFYSVYTQYVLYGWSRLHDFYQILVNFSVVHVHHSIIMAYAVRRTITFRIMLRFIVIQSIMLTMCSVRYILVYNHSNRSGSMAFFIREVDEYLLTGHLDLVPSFLFWAFPWWNSLIFEQK